MARPLKSGLDYFPHDTDASEDDRIEALSSLYGNDGYAFYFRLLERIYRKENFRLDLSSELTIKLAAKRCCLRVDRFQRILETALEVGLFSKEVFNNSKELFSTAITSRGDKVLRHRTLNRPSLSQKEGITAAVTVQETKQEPGVIAAVTTQQRGKDKVKDKVNNNSIISSFSDELVSEILQACAGIPAFKSYVVEHEVIKETIGKIGVKHGLISKAEVKIGTKRIDVVWSDQVGKWVAAIEIDAFEPKAGSLKKLKAATCPIKIVILRSCDDRYRIVDGIAYIGLGRERGSGRKTNPDDMTTFAETTRKKKYGTEGSVLLTEDQHQKLIEKFGEADAKVKIQVFEDALLSKGYKYNSHYHTILNWDRRDESKRAGAVDVSRPKFKEI
jgi:hypothetical protein